MTVANPLHLVLGDHAGAVLRLALGEADVHVIPDDFGHGPLDDGVARVEHMKRCCAGGFEWTHVEADAFAAWRALEDALIPPRITLDPSSPTEVSRRQTSVGDPAKGGAEGVDGKVDLDSACFARDPRWIPDAAARLKRRSPVEDDGMRVSHPREVVVWRGQNVSETVLLAMACWWLREVAAPIAVVDMPDTPTGHTHVGTRRPTELVGLLQLQRPLTAAERADWTTIFERLRSGRGLRRRWGDGRVVAVPMSAFDELLLACVGADWQPAARVVGEAMGRADPRDGLSDVFLSSRLQALIAEGRIETDVPPIFLRGYRVRLARRGAA